MTKKCELTGKSPLKGHRVSHANNKAKRKFVPNLKKVTFKSELLRRNIKLKVSNAALKTVDYKGGLDNFLIAVKKYKLSIMTSPLNDMIGVTIAIILLWIGGNEVFSSSSMNPDSFIKFISNIITTNKNKTATAPT